MTNEMEVWENEKPLALFDGVKDEMDLGGGVSNSYGVIGYRGKVWSLRYNGEINMFLRPDDGTPRGYIDVVILRAAEVKSKSYYPVWEEGTTGKRPDCASIDGVRPDKDVVNKQAEVCALCPRNQWYTNDKGKKTQDCSDYKRLAVFLLEQVPGTGTDTVPPQWKPYTYAGEPLLEPVFLRIPGGSLRELKAFGDEKAAKGYSPISFITRLSFVPGESYPKFVYQAKAPIRDVELAKIVLTLRDDTVAKRITGEEMVGQGSMRTIDEKASEPDHPTVRAGTVAPQTQRVAETPASAVAPAQGDGQVLELAAQKDGSYGDPSSKPANDNAIHAVGQTAADVGSSVDDPAMEALLAGLLELDS